MHKNIVFLPLFLFFSLFVYGENQSSKTSNINLNLDNFKINKQKSKSLLNIVDDYERHKIAKQIQNQLNFRYEKNWEIDFYNIDKHNSFLTQIFIDRIENTRKFPKELRYHKFLQKEFLEEQRFQKELIKNKEKTFRF